ncbi:MAG: carboxypeptidase regulatory-like domain-containing protein, partial [Deltaproteobacteria bacterium]|nr:carboxypeptidase regulatory-like domain-containing protein [Deltaproteobacteria bacterium]
PDAEGKFNPKVKAGRYQILITSKRYVTQIKEIEIRAGDTVILNVDLAPKR